MAKYLRLPDGSLYEVPDNMSYGEAMQLARKDYPDAFGAAQPQAQAPAEQPQAERTWGEAITDTGAGLVKGVGNLVQLPGQLYGLATGDFSDTGVLAAGKRIREAGEGMESDVLKQRRAAVQQKVQAAEGQGAIEAYMTSFMETLKDPALISSFIAEQLSQLLPIIATGGTAAGLAAGRASAAALAKGATADVAAKAAQAAAIKVGTTAAIQTGAVMQGTGVGADTYDAIYKNVLQRTKDPQKAAEAALNRARAAGVAGYGISVLANRYLPGGEALEKALFGGKTGVGMVTGAAAGALKEIPSENVEELGGALARNIALKDVDPTQSLTQGLGETAAQATLGAVALGGVAGANAGRGGAEIARAKRQEERATQERTAAEEAKAKAEQMADPQYLLDIGQRYDALIEQRKQLREITNRKVEKDDLEGQQAKQDARNALRALDEDQSNRELVRTYFENKDRIAQARRAPEDIMLDTVGLGAEPAEGIQPRGKAKGLYPAQPEAVQAPKQEVPAGVQWARQVTEWATDPNEVRIRPLEARPAQAPTGGLDDLAGLLMEQPIRARQLVETKANIPGLNPWQNTQLQKRLQRALQPLEEQQRGAFKQRTQDYAGTAAPQLQLEQDPFVEEYQQYAADEGKAERMTRAEIDRIEQQAKGASDYTGQPRLFADEAQTGAMPTRATTARSLAAQLQIARATGNRAEQRRLVEALRDLNAREDVRETEGPSIPPELPQELGVTGPVPQTSQLRERRDEAFAGYVSLVDRFNRGAAQPEQLQAQRDVIVNTLIREREENTGSPVSSAEGDLIARETDDMLRDLRNRFGDTRGTVRIGAPGAKDTEYAPAWENGELRRDLTDPGGTGFGSANIESFGPGYRTFGARDAAVRSIGERLDQLASTTAGKTREDITNVLPKPEQRIQQGINAVQQSGAQESDVALAQRLDQMRPRVMADTQAQQAALDWLDDVRANRQGSAQMSRRALEDRLAVIEQAVDQTDTRALPLTGRRGAAVAPENQGLPFQSSTEFSSFEELDAYLASDAIKEQRDGLGLAKDTMSRLNKRLEPLRARLAGFELALAQANERLQNARGGDKKAATDLVKEAKTRVDELQRKLDDELGTMRAELSKVNARMTALNERRAYLSREIEGIYNIWANASQVEQDRRADVNAAPLEIKQSRRAIAARMSFYADAQRKVADAYQRVLDTELDSTKKRFFDTFDTYLRTVEEAAVQLAELRKADSKLIATVRRKAVAEQRLAETQERHKHLIAFWEKEQQLVQEQSKLARQIVAARGAITKVSNRINTVVQRFEAEQGVELEQRREVLAQAQELQDEVNDRDGAQIKPLRAAVADLAAQTESLRRFLQPFEQRLKPRPTPVQIEREIKPQVQADREAAQAATEAQERAKRLVSPENVSREVVSFEKRRRLAEQDEKAPRRIEELQRLLESPLTPIEMREAARAELDTRRTEVDDKLKARLRNAEERSVTRNNLLQELKTLEARIANKALNQKDLARIEKNPELREQIEAQKAPLLEKLQEQRAGKLTRLFKLDARISRAFGVTRTPVGDFVTPRGDAAQAEVESLAAAQRPAQQTREIPRARAESEIEDIVSPVIEGPDGQERRLVTQPGGRAAGPAARNIRKNQRRITQARAATPAEEEAALSAGEALVSQKRLDKLQENLKRVQAEKERLKAAGRLKKGNAYTDRGRYVVDLERRVKAQIARVETARASDLRTFDAIEATERDLQRMADAEAARELLLNNPMDIEVPSEMRGDANLEFSDPIEPLTVDAQEAAMDGRLLDVLDTLADTGSNQLIRDSAAALRPLVMRTKLVVTEGPVTIDGKQVEAKFNPVTNTATFDRKYLGERTVVHELSHAATLRALNLPETELTDAQRNAKAELQRLFDDVASDPKLAGASFAEDLGEFTADLFSNTRLHDVLNRGMANWFKRFYNSVADLIGLPKLQLTSERALAQARELLMPSRQILTVKKSEVASVMRGVFPNANIKAAAGTPDAISKGVSQIVGRGEQSWWQKLQANVAGLAFRTQFLDNYAPIEQLIRMGVERGKLYSMRAFQTMYYLRFGQQRNQFLAQAASRGVPQLVKNPDGGFTYEAKEGPNLAEISRILSDADIGDAQQVEGEFTAFLAIRRAMQVPGGFEKLNTKEPMTRAQAEAFMADVAADPKRQQAFERAAEVYRQYNANLLDFLVQTGAMEKVKADALKRGDFVPFYRSTPDGTVELVVMGERPVRIGDIASQPYLKELLGDDQKILPVFTGALQNTAMLLDMGLRNQAVKDTAYTMRDLGMGKVGSGVGPTGARSKRNTLHFKEKGADRFLIMDEAALDQFGVPAELLVKGMEGIKTTLPVVVKAMGVPANWLRAGVTRMPTYALRQLIRDPINAWLVTGGNFTPVLSSLGEMAKMQGGRSPTEDVLQRAGAISSNVFTGDKADWSRTLRDISAGKNTWDTALAKLDAFATQGDTATRAVLYSMYRERGMTHMEALLGSLESMNFSRRGVSPTMHFLSTMIPFFNAQIQGLDVIYRAAKGVSLFEKETNARGKLLARGALMLGSTLLYAAMMQDDEAYKNATDQERALNWFVRFPGLDEPVRVPIPFELGYAFKAIPEMLINAAAEDKEAGDVVAGIAKLLYNSIPLGIPQALKPGIEVATNYSFYSGRDIVSTREQALEPEAQIRQNTTALAQMLSGLTGAAAPFVGQERGLSPIQIDYLIRGYFGGLGALVAQMPNIVFRPGAPDAQVERAERKLSELPVVGSLFQPTDGRGIIDEAYKTSQEFERKSRTYKALVEQGRRAEAQAFAQRYVGEIAAASEAGRFRQQMGEFAKYRRFIQASPSLSAQEKREQLDALRKIEIAYAQQLQALGKTTRQ